MVDKIQINDLTDLWDDSETAFSAIKINVTDIASAAESRLIDLRKDGVDYLYQRKDGLLALHQKGIEPFSHIASLNSYVLLGPISGETENRGIALGDGEIRIGYGGFIGWSNSRNPVANALGGVLTTELSEFPSDIYSLAVRHETDSMTWRVYDTFTDDDNYARMEMSFDTGVAVLSTQGIGTSSRPDLMFDSANRAPYDAAPLNTVIRDILISFGLMAAS